MSAYSHVGYVRYNSHPAAPLTIGDFEVMKGWKGDSDGGNDNEVIEIDTGKIWTGDLELTAPDVFVKGDREVVLLAELDGANLLKSYTVEELQDPLGAKFEEDPETWEIDVPSGAIVINIAYNATPEKGASTDDLDELCWFDGLPFLPKEAPKKPYHYNGDKNLEWRAHAIVPVKRGKYRVEMGTVEGGDNGFMRLVLRHQR